MKGDYNESAKISSRFSRQTPNKTSIHIPSTFGSKIDVFEKKQSVVSLSPESTTKGKNESNFGLVKFAAIV